MNMAKRKRERKIPVSVAIAADQIEWLRDHPEINLSRFVREKIDELQKGMNTQVRMARDTFRNNTYNGNDIEKLRKRYERYEDDFREYYD